MLKCVVDEREREEGCLLVCPISTPPLLLHPGSSMCPTHYLLWLYRHAMYCVQSVATCIVFVQFFFVSIFKTMPSSWLFLLLLPASHTVHIHTQHTHTLDVYLPCSLVSLGSSLCSRFGSLSRWQSSHRAQSPSCSLLVHIGIAVSFDIVLLWGWMLVMAIISTVLLLLLLFHETCVGSHVSHIHRSQLKIPNSGVLLNRG